MQPTKPKVRKAAYDSPWKVAVERLFPHYLAFFFAEIHALIDWTRPYKFLAQELEQLSAGIESEPSARRGFAKGRRSPLRVDLLVEVYFKDGGKGRILLHCEIQNEREVFFDERLFIYHYRIFDKFREPVITLALLTDFDPNWRPGRYVRETAGCRVEFVFPVRKLMDYNAEELAQSRNPFAFIAQAHLKARATGDDVQQRYDLRLVLQEAVDNSGLRQAEAIQVTRFIEEVMRLPAELDRQLYVERKARKEKPMEFYSYAERVGEKRGQKRGEKLGEKRGEAKGKRESLALLLQMRFGALPKRVQAKIARLTDLAVLDELFASAYQCQSLKEFEAQLPKEKAAAQ